MTSTERRRSPRIKDDGPGLDVKGGGLAFVAHTLNISESGIYCKVEHELPLMSRIELRLKIPAGEDAKGTDIVNVSGVVVRQHPVIIDGETKHYDVAIFFDDLSEKGRNLIAGYIKNRQK